MLKEFSAGRQVSYRVNPQQNGSVETVSEVYAVDYFKEIGGDAIQNSAAFNNPDSNSGTNVASSRRLRRRVQAALERIFLPAGYPNSVTDDLLTFALWDAAQVLATNVMTTLSTRAVLLGVGVGESGANLTSSTLSWMMRDGTWLIGSIFFASAISQDLEYRAKSWRLVADITNDTATFLELCAPLFPGGQFTFRLVVVIASIVKALVGVCGGGTRASFTQHFALRSNAADVAAKAGTRGNIGSLIGLALGMIVAYIVPASSTLMNLSVFVLCTSFHLFANYKGVRGVQLRHLNAPRLEWCCEQFRTFQERAVIAMKKESGPKSVMPVLDISIRRANAAEPLFILPTLPVMITLSQQHAGLSAVMYRFLRQYLRPFALRLRIHCGASFHKLLKSQTDLSTLKKQELVHRVSESLSVRGIALLFDERSESYYMILPEFYTVEGVPESWVRYKRQYEAGRFEETKHHKRKSASEDTTQMGKGEGSYKTAVEEADEEARAEIERLRKERVVVPPHVLPLAYRELWAFFYAYMHYLSVCERRERGTSGSVLTSTNSGTKEKLSKRSDAEGKSTVHLITHLRADGAGSEGTGEGSNDEHENSDNRATMIDPDTFETMTSPTTTSSKVYVLSSEADNSNNEAAAPTAVGIAPQDGLYALFIEFVRGLRRAGWELDHLLIANEGCTTVVDYM